MLNSANHLSMSGTKRFSPAKHKLSRSVLDASLVLAFAATTGLSGSAFANTLQLEEVVVTAQKRSQSLQDVPISMNAINSDQLDDLNITQFGDYVAQIPSVSFIQRRPGEAQLFMRGISDGGNGNQSLQGPAVAIYLDEQPVTAIGLNLDVHVYDVERIEVLMGPQGTLYGVASQAGNLRIITKKPNPEGFEAGFDLSADTISGGGNGYMAEGYVNIPLSSNAALRLVGWHDSDGGYIDSVLDTITYPVSGISKSSSEYVKKDFNTSKKSGLRAALKVDLNENWTATASVMQQETETDGIWDHDPEVLGSMQVSRFFDDRQNDEWTQMGLLLEGNLGFADLTYAGSYLDRDYEVYSDYSAYSISGYVEPYYTCYTSYFGPCVDPSVQFINESDITFETHELRLTSDQEQRFRWIVGAFYMKNETAYDSQWSVPPINPGAAVRDDLYFETDQVRMDSETAFFGEFSYDITDQLTATVGLRDFDSETTLEGFVGTVWWPNCCFTFSDSRPPDNVNSKFEGSDNTFKVNVAYTLNDDVLIYGTVSEGYRPGGANRTEQVGATYDADFVTSYELGVKSTLSDGRIRLNAAMYTMDWDDMQLGFFNPDISLLGLVDNVGAAESQGFELDATWLATEQLEINMSYAYNKAELTQDYDRRNDGTPDAFSGQDLPFTPDTKWALTARYNFDWMGGDGYLMSNTTFTDSMYNGIFLNSREEMDSYTISQVSLGLARDQWTAELFASNVFDEEAELYINTADIKRLVTVNRPRTIGFRFGMRFE